MSSEYGIQRLVCHVVQPTRRFKKICQRGERAGSSILGMGTPTVGIGPGTRSGSPVAALGLIDNVFLAWSICDLRKSIPGPLGRPATIWSALVICSPARSKFLAPASDQRQANSVYTVVEFLVKSSYRGYL